MDGTLAVIFLIASLTDMGLNHCASGCLRSTTAPAMATIGAGGVFFQEQSLGSQFFAGLDAGRKFGPFQPNVGVLITDDAATWVGAGARWATAIGGPDSSFFVDATLMAGLYLRGDGPDLGGNLQFRSSVGAGYAFDNGNTLSISLDHRSNADTSSVNPGLETVSIRYAFLLD